MANIKLIISVVVKLIRLRLTSKLRREKLFKMIKNKRKLLKYKIELSHCTKAHRDNLTSFILLTSCISYYYYYYIIVLYYLQT